MSFALRGFEGSRAMALKRTRFNSQQTRARRTILPDNGFTRFNATFVFAHGGCPRLDEEDRT